MIKQYSTCGSGDWSGLALAATVGIVGHVTAGSFAVKHVQSTLLVAVEALVCAHALHAADLAVSADHFSELLMMKKREVCKF